MESNDSAQAREALNSIHATRVGLADRLVTPWFYYPVLGLLLGGMGLLYGLEQTRGSNIRLFSALLVVFGSIGLATLYSRRTGVTITKPLGPRSRKVFAVLCVGLVAPLLVLIVVEPPQGVAIGFAVFLLVFTILAGRAYDASLRADLRGGAR